jgi:aspartate/methionine/tyrosine aminotransferase
MELFGIHPAIKALVYKLASVQLCPNLPGQIAVDLMVDPPRPGDPSHERHEAERAAIRTRLADNARLVETRLNALEGVTCQPIEGAMYAFPRITPPPGAVSAASQRGRSPDLDYCLSLLDSTGICTVPGAGFGLPADGYHLRMTILPPPDRLAAALDRFAAHHAGYMDAHG